MILINNIGELLTSDTNQGKPIRGRTMNNPGIIHDAAIVIEDDHFVASGPRHEILSKYDNKIDKEISANNGLVTPGLVDPHTHAVFAGTRELEFEMRIEGRSYMEISKAGGGILNTARRVRESNENQLAANTTQYLQTMISHGITTCEIKSGYGLSTESELMMLRTIATVADRTPMDIIPTFLGAHEIPENYRPDNKAEYIQLIINEMLPIVVKENLAKFVDIFCEEGVFELEDTEILINAALSKGLGIKLHADEIQPMGGSELGVRYNAISVDHLVAISEKGIDVLSKSNTVATLLPGTSFFLALGKYAPARKLIDSDALVALSTDFNPGSSPTTNASLIMSIACSQMKMTPAECFVAYTINSAAAIGMDNIVGSITPNKQADLVIWNANNYRQIPYFYGENLVSKVIKKGSIIKI